MLRRELGHQTKRPEQKVASSQLQPMCQPARATRKHRGPISVTSAAPMACANAAESRFAVTFPANQFVAHSRRDRRPRGRHGPSRCRNPEVDGFRNSVLDPCPPPWSRFRMDRSVAPF
jgi:hypothetical protein